MALYFHIPDSALGGIDEYTKLMLHMDGADDGTLFTDSSLSPHTINRYNALTKTGTKKFGTAAGYFDGSGDLLTVPDSDDWNFGSGDFTIDLWFNFNSIGPAYTLCSQYRAGSASYWPTSSFQFLYNGTIFFFSAVTGSSEVGLIGESYTPTVGVWYHIAITRSGNDWRMFINGTQLGSTVVNSLTSTYELFIGARYYSQVGNDQFLNGYIDELRISKGIARWTSNFTPESGPYTE